MKYLKAATSENKEKEMNRVAEQLELELDLIGSTAIEDKLQEEVGQTIYDIRQAGIKVWVLTGDKVETAMNIGHACRLLESEMNMFLIQKMDVKGVTKEIEDAFENQTKTKNVRENAVIIAGETLSLIQQN